MKKTFFAVFLAASFFVFQTSAFDWPQKEITSKSFYTFFGHLRGQRFCPSIVFSGSTEIKTVESGRVKIVLSEHDEETDLFESTLGNAVIIEHEDQMMSVYANLDISGQTKRYKLTNAEAGTALGECGNSGWQEGNGLLEFQIIDEKNKAFVNPRILMPHLGDELPLSIKSVSALNVKSGASYDLRTQTTIPSGVYRIYRELQTPAMPYKTTILINGVSVENITYDTLVQEKGKLCTSGKGKYPSEVVYPDEKRHMIGEITIPKGRNRISVEVENISGKSLLSNYILTAY